MTIREIELKFLKTIAPLDRELIFSHVIGKSREFVLTHPEFRLTAPRAKRITGLLKRRAKGEPLAYLTGHKEFFGLDFRVDRHTLVPRPETELLVELALDELHNSLRNKLRNIAVVDVGTGSGNIIVSIAKSMKHETRKGVGIGFWGIDISTGALKIARQNLKDHNLDKAIKMSKGDLLGPIAKKCSMFHDPCSMIITANLPYLDSDWKNLLGSSETRGLRFEPSSALYAGQDGLDEYRRLATQIRQLRKESDCQISLFCEIGHRQKTEMAKIFAFANMISFFKDLAGHWRVAKIQL